MSAADLLMHMHRGAAGPAGAPRTGPQHGPHLPARAPAGVIADPLRLAQELELVAAHMRSVADQAKFHVQSFRQHRRTSSSSGSAESSSSFQSDHRVSSSSSSSSRQPNGGGQGSSINQQHAFRAKGTVSPEGKFEFEAEMDSATSAVKVSKNAAGDKQGQAQGQGGASLDSSWSIPVSELMHPDKIAAAGQGQGNKSPIGSGQEQEAEPVIQFPTQPDSPTPHRPSSSSDSTLTRAAAKPLRITETHELSEWPATWTWAQANKFAAPLMFTLLLSTILARWIAMRRAVAAHRARRGHKRVRHEQVVELQQVVDQVVTDERGNVIGVEETVSVEKRVMPTVASDSSPGHRNIQEHYDRKQRDWKFDAVRIPFWYTLSSLATLAMCLALDFLVLRPYTLPVAPPAAAAVNHPMVDFGLAVLHTGVVAATMASLARTVGFVRKEWDQYQRGE